MAQMDAHQHGVKRVQLWTCIDGHTVIIEVARVDNVQIAKEMSNCDSMANMQVPSGEYQ